MRLYLHMKTEGTAPVARVTANFNVEYRTSLPLSDSDMDFYADLLTKIHMGVERANTRFEIYPAWGELIASYAEVRTDAEHANIYVRTSVKTTLIPIGEKARDSVIRETIHKTLEVSNNVLNAEFLSSAAEA